MIAERQEGFYIIGVEPVEVLANQVAAFDSSKKVEVHQTLMAMEQRLKIVNRKRWAASRAARQ